MIPRSNAPRSQRSRAQTGFSLIETMVVVTIIGIMAASVMPAMTDMLANTRQQSAATDIMLMARAARREALLGHYAHALDFRQDLDNENGAIRVITGVTGHCNRSADLIELDPAWSLRGWQPSVIGRIFMNAYAFSGQRMYARMQMPEGVPQPTLRICYAANGETWVTSPVVPNSEQLQAAVLFVNRSSDGRDRGVARQVVFSTGGTARVR